MAHDYSALVLDQLEDLAALADSFSEEQWDTPSLCEGWKVRDVISGGRQQVLDRLDGDGVNILKSRH